MGNICARSRLVTFTEERPLTVQPGPVALVGQSGGMMIFTNLALQERGISPDYLITSGNEAGLSVADYIAFFADQPELKVIIIYVEAIANLEKFKAACRMARVADKSIVAVKLGQSEGGRSAAMAHTGSLAGRVEAFDAVAGEVGVIRADTLDDAVEITELLVHTGAPPGRRLGAVTLSGAYRGLLLDSAERNGLAFHPLAGATTQRLNAVLTVGSLVGNPIDGGFGVLSSADNFMTSIDALQADPNVDMVLVQETLPRAPGSDRTEHYIRLVDDYAATKATKPIAFITPISHGQNDYSRALRAKAPHVSFLQEAYKGLRAIASVARREERERLARDHRTRAGARAGAGDRARRGRIQERAARLWDRDAGRGAGHIGRGSDPGGRAYRLSRGPQGGVRAAPAQVGRGRGGAWSCDPGAIDGGLRPDDASFADARFAEARHHRHAGVPADQRRPGARARPAPRS
jgi:acetyltransferase